MERKMASIQTVAEVKAIPEADLICAYRINGWWLVDTVGKYRVGEKVVYCEPDAWVPNALAPFLSKGKEPREFNGVKGEKLRTVRLKKQVSQGLLLPLSPTCDMIDSELFEGLDVSIPLNIQKWEAPLPACLVGQAKGLFPSFLRKSDQERIENYVYEVFTENKDSKFEVTLKLDGSSCSTYFKDGEVGVCSRNLELKLNEDNASNTFIATATKTGLLEALTKMGKNLMVQAELVGPNIQGNKDQFMEHNLYVFDIFDIDSFSYLSPANRILAFQELKAYGFMGTHVPIRHIDVTLEELGITDVATSKVYADTPSINAKIAEGYVFKRMDGKFSFKSINTKFLLKFSEE